VASGAADIRYTLAGAVAAAPAAAGAVLPGAQLMRSGRDEPEPHVLRWDEVDTASWPSARTAGAGAFPAS
jgi:hypothetical protein